MTQSRVSRVGKDEFKKLLVTCKWVIVVSIIIASCASPTGTHSQNAPSDSPSGQSNKIIDQHCTVFYAADDHVALGGNNEDNYYPVLTRIWFVPPEEGRYGMALVGYDNFGNPEGAMNDQGLFYDGLAVRDTEVPVREGTLRNDDFAIMKIMTECGTVACALEFFQKYSVSGHWRSFGGKVPFKWQRISSSRRCHLKLVLTPGM